MSDERFNAILDLLPDPVLLLEPDRTVTFANKAANELLGENLVGRDLVLVFRHPEAVAGVEAVLNGGETSHESEVVLPVPVRRTFKLIVSAGQDQTGAIMILRDITLDRAAETLRSDFIANVSHELRSPLSSLSGFIETLQTSARDDEEARDRFLTIMASEAGRMSRLIGDLLSLSKIEVNEHIRPRDKIDINKLLRQVIGTLSLRADERGIRFEFDPPRGLTPVAGEHDQLVEVFQNLLDNAVKYADENTVVSVRAEEHDSMSDIGGSGVEITVRDRGRGITKEHLPRLTERFYRADKNESRSLGGTGLGLAIVKHIVNRHRGRLIIDSTPGEGTTVKVRLPHFRG
jgi:two-component system phosphate regulon sensor histidine kinase PhoR